MVAYWNVNLALGKPTKQTRTLKDEESSHHAVDGNRDKYNWAIVRGAFSWWEVDLENIYRIQEVVITNRKDCCGKLN